MLAAVTVPAPKHFSSLARSRIPTSLRGQVETLASHLSAASSQQANTGVYMRMWGTASLTECETLDLFPIIVSMSWVCISLLSVTLAARYIKLWLQIQISREGEASITGKEAFLRIFYAYRSRKFDSGRFVDVGFQRASPC